MAYMAFLVTPGWAKSINSVMVEWGNVFSSAMKTKYFPYNGLGMNQGCIVCTFIDLNPGLELPSILRLWLVKIVSLSFPKTRS